MSVLATGCTNALSKGLSLYFMCSDQPIKYQMTRGYSLTGSLLLEYHAQRSLNFPGKNNLVLGPRIICERHDKFIK